MTIQPRAYQIAMVRGWYHAVRAGSLRHVTQMCPGAGKTLVAYLCARDVVSKGRPFWFFAPRRGLVTQPVEKFAQYGGLPDVQTVMAGHAYDLSRPGVRVASIDTLIERGIQLEANAVCVIDECHMEKLAPVMDTQPATVTWHGLTGTPVFKRGTWTSMECGPQPSELVRMGALSEHASVVPEEDTAALEAGAIIGNPVEWWHRHAAGLRTLAFCRNKREARAHAAHFPGRAAVLTCDDQDHVRTATLARLEARELDVVCNVGLYQEGTDIPWLECLHDLAPTNSVAAHIQRSARLWRVGGAAKMHLDQAGNFWRHGPPQVDRTWSLTGPNGVPVRVAGLFPCTACRYLRGGPGPCARCGATPEVRDVAQLTAPGMDVVLAASEQIAFEEKRRATARERTQLKRFQAQEWAANDRRAAPLSETDVYRAAAKRMAEWRQAT